MTRTNILSMVRGHCFESWGFNLLTTRGGFYYWKDLPRRRLSYRHMQGTCPKWLSWEWGLCTGSTDSHTTLCTPEEAGPPLSLRRTLNLLHSPFPYCIFFLGQGAAGQEEGSDCLGKLSVQPRQSLLQNVTFLLDVTFSFAHSSERRSQRQLTGLTCSGWSLELL